MTQTLLPRPHRRHAQPAELWPAVVIPKETIDAEVERLASLPRPANGRRRSLIRHPHNEQEQRARAGHRGRARRAAAGRAHRSLSAELDAGEFRASAARAIRSIGGKRFASELYDVWNTPSMHAYWHGNDGKALLVRLTYSNAALLEMMNIHYVEENPPAAEAVKHEEMADEDKKRRVSPYGTFKLTDDGAYLMPYEALINPPAVESKALHWPWQECEASSTSSRRWARTMSAAGSICSTTR